MELCEAGRGAKSWQELERRAGVRIDLAVQSDFFKLRCGPLHWSVPLSLKITAGAITAANRIIAANLCTRQSR